MDASIIDLIANALIDQILSLEKSGDGDLEFIYRWTQDGKPVTARIARAGLISELAVFRQFLLGAAKTESIATFSL